MTGPSTMDTNLSTQESDENPAKKICLFGGTFDPIHLGHTHIAAAAVQQFDLDTILFLPCQQSPHKPGQQHASAVDRLTMCRLATDELDWAEVDDFDLTAPPPSYSWRTAEAMTRRFPNAQLYWLMGTDQWQVLPKWHQPEKLAKLVEFIVFTRGEKPPPLANFRMLAIHGNHSASATAIRHAPLDNKNWLHPNVAAYIQKHHLYQK